MVGLFFWGFWGFFCGFVWCGVGEVGEEGVVVFCGVCGGGLFGEVKIWLLVDIEFY